MAAPIRTDRSLFQVAVICALQEEYSAMAAALDDTYGPLGKSESDENTYTPGRIGRHYVVIVQLPDTGIVPAATASGQVRSSYPKIKLGLVVGVCAGAPKDRDGQDIILGDVLISTQVLHTSHARMLDSGIEPYNEVERSLSRAPKDIRSFVKTYSSDFQIARLQPRLPTSVEDLLKKEYLRKYAYPVNEKDMLFRPNRPHQHLEDCAVCPKNPAQCMKAREADCTELGCGNTYEELRERLKPLTGKEAEPGSDKKPSQSASAGLPESDIQLDMPPPSPPQPSQPPQAPQPPRPCVHFGRIGSSDLLIRSGSYGQDLIHKYKFIGFEMEGAGVWDNLPTLVIKGVSDYADGHKNKKFQPYAAVTAAAWAKILLEHWDPVEDPQNPQG